MTTGKILYLGNVTRSHVVIPGDTLATLASRYYAGQPENDIVNLLARANGISPTGILTVGMKISLPQYSPPATTLPDGTPASGTTLEPITVTAPKPLWMKWQLWAVVGGVGLLAYLLLSKKRAK